jgi:hypothetical protein
MEQKLNQIVAKIKESWELMSIEDLSEIQGLIGELTKVKFSVKPALTSKGIELYRDSEDGKLCKLDKSIRVSKSY